MKRSEASCECVFCRELAGSKDTNFAKRYPEVSSRIVGKTDSLVAFPCIGQLLPGHFLIVPKRHYATMSEARAEISNFDEELRAIVSHVHGLIEVTESANLYFEHGARGNQDGGCGIYHAHLHVVPNAGHVDPMSLFPFKANAPLSCLAGAWSQLHVDSSYALVGTARHGFYSQHLSEPLPSQSLRRALSVALKTDSWDWRRCDREAGMLAMLNQVVAR